MKFLNPNEKPFDISQKAGSLGAVMGHEIAALEDKLDEYLSGKVPRADRAAVLCLHYLTAAARAAATFFETEEEKFPLDDFLASARDCAVFVVAYAEANRRMPH